MWSNQFWINYRYVSNFPPILYVRSKLCRYSDTIIYFYNNIFRTSFFIDKPLINISDGVTIEHPSSSSNCPRLTKSTKSYPSFLFWCVSNSPSPPHRRLRLQSVSNQVTRNRHFVETGILLGSFYNSLLTEKSTPLLIIR